MATLESPAAKVSWSEAFAVYLKPRVLIVILLGFSAGLPLALSGATLAIWMTEADVNLAHHRALCAGRPALHAEIPVGAAGRCARHPDPVARARPAARLAGVLATPARRRDRCSSPSRIRAASLWPVALGAVMVATASATQDIVIDAFRVESLDTSEQAAGMAGYVAAYRIGMLASGAGVHHADLVARADRRAARARCGCGAISRPRCWSVSAFSPR